jgi:hypothetical protein
MPPGHLPSRAGLIAVSGGGGNIARAWAELQTHSDRPGTTWPSGKEFKGKRIGAYRAEQDNSHVTSKKNYISL